MPKSWRKYKIPDGLLCNDWIIDLCSRLTQLADFASVDARNDNLRAMRVWMGGLFIPEAFITATRQTVAQAHGACIWCCIVLWLCGDSMLSCVYSVM